MGAMSWLVRRGDRGETNARGRASRWPSEPSRGAVLMAVNKHRANVFVCLCVSPAVGQATLFRFHCQKQSPLVVLTQAIKLLWHSLMGLDRGGDVTLQQM